MLPVSRYEVSISHQSSKRFIYCLDSTQSIHFYLIPDQAMDLEIFWGKYIYFCILAQTREGPVSWNASWWKTTLRWRHNEWGGVSSHQPHDCLLNRLSGHRSKKTSKPRVTGPCAENSPGTGEFPAQMASNAETVSIWWRHHEGLMYPT